MSDTDISAPDERASYQVSAQELIDAIQRRDPVVVEMAQQDLIIAKQRQEINALRELAAQHFQTPRQVPDEEPTVDSVTALEPQPNE